MKRISTKRTGFLKPAMLAMSFALFGACASDEEANDNNKSEKVTVRFTVSEQPFGTTETFAARSASDPTSDLTSETTDDGNIVEEKLTHVFGDLYARTTLVETASPATRATTALGDGKTLRIIAYTKGTTTIQFRADYTITTGGALNEPTPAVNNLVSGTPYDFVAYSYNSTWALPTYAATHTIDVNTDLLYYSSKADYPNGRTLSGGVNDITLVLKRLLAKVTVRVSTDKLDDDVNGAKPKITAATATLILPNGYTGSSLNVSTGVLSGGAAMSSATLAFSFIGGTTSTITKDFYVRAGGGEATATLSFLALTVSGVSPHTALETLGAYLTPVTLEGGHSYTLALDFDYLRFADSNVYWDDNKLAFFEHGELNGNPGKEVAKKRMQGVMFKFGSLVGVAAGTNGSPFVVGTNGGSDGTPLYFYDGSQWKTMNAATANATYSSVFTAATYAAIPYIDANLTILPFVSRRSDDLLRWKQLSAANAADWSRGDICRVLTADADHPNGTYRLPVSAEFEALSTANLTPDPTGSWSNQTPTTPAGTDLITNHRKTAGGLVLPTSGFRYNGGTLNNMGTASGYRSSTVYTNASNAYDIYFMYSNIFSSDNFDRAAAESIRCLKIN